MEWYWIVLIATGWYVIGIFGHWWWWTKDYDYEIVDLGIGLMTGFLGALAWIVGYFIHHKSNEKVLFKQR